MFEIQQKVVTETVTGLIDGVGIIQMLIEKKLIHPNAKDISITFDVPRGGDYSGMRLDMKDEVLEIKYTV
jgi:hypothetical protein